MPVRSDIKGLTEVGSTAQTIALADELYRNEDARKLLRAILDNFEDEQTYSGEDGDRKHYCSISLANIIRKYNGPEIN
jgi:hypothetical protein